MNRINRKVEYALMALRHLHLRKPGELSTVKEISELYHCPYDLTARVMQQMTHAGILKSEQGAHGGYQLVRDLSKLSIHELMELLLGPVELAKCLGTTQTGAQCELISTCNIQTPIQNLHYRLSLFYQSLSVADLFLSRPGRPRLGHPQEALNV